MFTVYPNEKDKDVTKELFEHLKKSNSKIKDWEIMDMKYDPRQNSGDDLFKFVEALKKAVEFRKQVIEEDEEENEGVLSIDACYEDGEFDIDVVFRMDYGSTIYTDDKKIVESVFNLDDEKVLESIAFDFLDNGWVKNYWDKVEEIFDELHKTGCATIKDQYVFFTGKYLNAQKNNRRKLNDNHLYCINEKTSKYNSINLYQLIKMVKSN